jgi:prolyl-tRNA synthetase
MGATYLDEGGTEHPIVMGSYGIGPARVVAAAAEQGHDVEQARYEDKLREADKVDPDVNTRSQDYQPDVWSDQRDETAATSTTAQEPGTASTSAEGDTPRHAADTGTTSSTTSPTAPSEETAVTSEERRRSEPT